MKEQRAKGKGQSGKGQEQIANWKLEIANYKICLAREAHGWDDLLLVQAEPCERLARIITGQA